MANALRIQRPTPPNKWLYQDQSENYRYFTDFVFLGKNEPEWKQCTQEKREEWEREHEHHEPEPNEEAAV